jgi:hypothetical protein
MIYTRTLIFSLLGLINANNSGDISGSSGSFENIYNHSNIDLSSGLSDDLSGDLSSGSGNYSGDSILEDKNTHYYIYIIVVGVIFLALMFLMVCKFTDQRSNIPIYPSRNRQINRPSYIMRNRRENVEEGGNVEEGENVEGEIKNKLYSFQENMSMETDV